MAQEAVALADAATPRAAVRKRFEPLFGGTGGIDSWLGDQTPDSVFTRLETVDSQGLSFAVFNQLLVLSHEAAAGAGFLDYYWKHSPKAHPYDVTKLPGYDAKFLTGAPEQIQSLTHLYWGFYRFYVDALLYFGSIRTAYRQLRSKDSGELALLFRKKQMPHEAMVSRGPSLELLDIAKDNRYLIAEVACKSYDLDADGVSALQRALVGAWKELERSGGKRAKISELLNGKFTEANFAKSRQQLLFSADELLDKEVTSEEELLGQFQAVAKKFTTARQAAIENTKRYLSVVNDLDVYVATSMRSREDFRKMGTFCERVFEHKDLAPYNLRFFDPTRSAAEGHLDKGLIECLMVKCAKILVYVAGERESYGKDAEAAMALSLGKPVVFYCDEAGKSEFYREAHPLSRLIEFETGVAVGAIVATSENQVVELLRRLITNDMRYRVEKTGDSYLRLVEVSTSSVVRLQTSDPLLRETFWNHYHV